MAVARGPEPAHSAAFPGSRILVVDDEDAVRRTLTVLFKRRGYHAVEAASAREALNHVARESFDLVILDLTMPEMDGTRMMQAARRLAPDTVFIILATFGTLDSAIVAVRHGAFSYVLKPSREEEIVRAVEVGLAERQRRLHRKEPHVPLERTLRDIKSSVDEKEQPPPRKRRFDTPDVTMDTLWQLVNYLARAVAAYETRMYRRASQTTAAVTQPYKSLYSYEIEDADTFFGRDGNAEALRHKVMEDRLTILHGRIGAGKTSLLNAGLTPRLVREGRLPVFARAGRDPVHAIKLAVAPASQEPWPQLLNELTLQQFLNLVCERLSRQTRELVVVVDQYEDYFVNWPEPEHRQPFIDALTECYNDRSLPIRIILCTSTQYFSDLAELKAGIPTALYNEYWLGPMTRQDVVQAITAPLGALERPVNFEPALIDTILKELPRGVGLVPPSSLLRAEAQHPEQRGRLAEMLAYGGVSGGAQQERELPQLQLICARLHNALPRDERVITLGLYEELGRAKGIVSGYLQGVLDRLGEKKAFTGKKALKALVSSQATKRVLGTGSLAVQVGVSEGELAAVLAALVDARVLRREEVAGESRYELAHEYLITEIGTWIEREELAFKHVQELLAREVAIWRMHGTLLPADRLEILHSHREWLAGLERDAQGALLRSAIKAGFQIEDWAKLAGDAGEPLLLDALGDEREEVRQAVIRSLGALRGLPELSSLGDERWDVRRGSARALGKMGDRGAVIPLIATLRDGNHTVRRTAASALGELGDARAIRPLSLSLQDESGQVRQAAVESLIKLGEPAMAPLVVALNSSIIDVRANAADALGKLGDARAEKPLLATLRDKEHVVRRAAIRGLGGIWQLPELAQLGDEDRYVAWDAARALGDLGDSRAVEPLVVVLRDEHKGLRQAAALALAALGEPAVERLTAALDDWYWEVRWGAALALGEIGHQSSVEPLAVALRDQHSDVRQAAVEALAKFGEPALPSLTLALKDGVGDVRAKAVEALGKSAELQAIGPLIGALRDSNTDVRRKATEALVKLGKLATAPLIVAAADGDRYVRRAATEALGQIGDSAAVDALIKALGDKDHYVRRSAVMSLERIGDSRSVEPLILALQDEDRIVRREVTWALGELGSARVVPSLIDALQDDDRGVRQAAALALIKLRQFSVELLTAALKNGDSGLRWSVTGLLGDLGDSRAVEPLIAVLQDPDEVVRRTAATSLGKIGDSHAVGPLIVLLQDEDSGVRWSATGALGKLGDPRAVDPLILTLKDNDSTVRLGAADALTKIGTPAALEALSK